jgi:type III secretory pathway component EscV
VYPASCSDGAANEQNHNHSKVPHVEILKEFLVFAVAKLCFIGTQPRFQKTTFIWIACFTIRIVCAIPAKKKKKGCAQETEKKKQRRKKNQRADSLYAKNTSSALISTLAFFCRSSRVNGERKEKKQSERDVFTSGFRHRQEKYLGCWPTQ